MVPSEIPSEVPSTFPTEWPYPNCLVELRYQIGDGRCDGGDFNTEDCAYDGGDCINFNIDYPNCTVQYPYFIGDGFCDDDGADYHSGDCGFDEDDCADIKEQYPDCPGPHGWLGDCECDHTLNTTECGFDNGDCVGSVDCRRRSLMKQFHKWENKRRILHAFGL